MRENDTIEIPKGMDAALSAVTERQKPVSAGPCNVLADFTYRIGRMLFIFHKPERKPGRESYL